MKTKFRFAPILLVPVLLTFLLVGTGYSGATITDSLTWVKTFGTQPATNGLLSVAEGMVVTPLMGNVMVSDSALQKVQIFQPAAGTEGAYVGKLSGTFANPCSMAFGPLTTVRGVSTGLFYVANSGMAANTAYISVYKYTHTPATLSVPEKETFSYLTKIDSTNAGLVAMSIPMVGPKGVAASNSGAVYVTDSMANLVLMFMVGGTTAAPTFTFCGAANSAGGTALFLPYGVAVDNSGTTSPAQIYVSDFQNSRMVAYTTSWNGAGFTFNDVIQWGSYKPAQYTVWTGFFNNPMGVTVDTAGWVHVVDEQNCRALKFDSTGTIAAGGTYYVGYPSFSYPNGLVFPRGIAVDAARNHIYVSDTASHVIKDFDYTTVGPAPLYGQAIDDVWSLDFVTAGEDGIEANPLANGLVNFPYGIAQNVANSTVYVADSYNHRLEWFKSTGVYVGQYGKYYEVPGATPPNDYMVWPFGVAIDYATGYVYFNDAYLTKVLVYDPVGGTILNVFGGKGDPKTGPAAFVTPMGMVVYNHVLYVCDYLANVIYMYDTTSSPIGAYLGTMVTGVMNNPMGIAVDSGGDFYITDASNTRVKVIMADGSVHSFGASYLLGGEFLTPCGIGIDNEGFIYVSDITLHALYKFTPYDPTPELRWQLIAGNGGLGMGKGQYYGPYGVAVGTGIYVADTFNSRIQEFGLSTVSSIVPTKGELGQAIAIKGKFYNPNSVIQPAAVTIGGVLASSCSYTAPVPPLTVTTEIDCYVPAGLVAGSYPVIVATIDGAGVSPKLFTVAAPSITTMLPTSGTRGTVVTITGKYFGTTGSMTFNANPLTPDSWSDTSIVFTVPLTAGAGTKAVVVTNDAGSSTSHTFTVKAPSINSLLVSPAGLVPSSGPVGTSVTINGNNFGTAGGNTVTFYKNVNAGPAESSLPSACHDWTNTSVTCPVPSGAITGNVTVTNGVGTSNGVKFTVTAGP